MIAFAEPYQQQSAAKSKPAWHAGFAALLPDIRNQLRFAFRNLSPEEREEATQDAVARAAVAYAELHRAGRAALAYATPLARYAAAQYRAGRRVGGSLNINDITSPHAQRRHGIRLARLDRFDAEEGGWKEVLVEGRSGTPAELAASRIDFADWLGRLPKKKRRIATTLAAGETTSDVGRKFRITPGRVSQLRREFAESWQAFHGELLSRRDSPSRGD